MLTLKFVQTVTFQDGKVMSLKVNKVLMFPPWKEKRKLQRFYSGSLKAKIATTIYIS